MRREPGKGQRIPSRPGFSARGGLAIGMAFAFIFVGHAQDDQTLIYDKFGVAFVVDRDGILTRI